MAVQKQLTERQQRIIDEMTEDVLTAMRRAVQGLWHEPFVGGDMPYFDARDTVEDAVARMIEEGLPYDE